MSETGILNKRYNDRQEVTIDWYLKHMSGYCFFRYIEEADKYNLDPWRYHMDFPVPAEIAKKRKWRIFVQISDLNKAGFDCPENIIEL